MTERTTVVFGTFVILCGLNTVLSLNINDVQFYCDSSNHVVLPQTNMTNFRLLQTNGAYCTPKTDHFTECTVENTASIKVLYTIEKDSNVVAGQQANYFQLSCVDQRTKIKLTAAKFEVDSTQSPTYSIKNITVDPTVSMVIQKNGGALPNFVNIGDQLKLIIQGPDKHTMSVTNCTATDGTLQHDIWAPCNFDEAIIGEQWNWNATTNELTNDLYAFRFVNSASVTIECLVNVCPASDTSCNDDLTKQTCTSIGTGRRRKRSQDDLETRQKMTDTHVASVSFNVRTAFDSANASPGLYTAGILKTMALVVALYLHL